jgi:hypothetical protein
MLGRANALQRRRRQRTYARFLDATVALIDASTACWPRLSRPGRIVIGAAILRACEADHAARCALLTTEPGRIEEALARLELARGILRDAGRHAALDVARRRSISLAAPRVV